MPVVTISCDRVDAEEVEAQLRSLGATDLRLGDHDKRFEGLADILTIVSSLTSVAASAFQVWALTKERSGAKLKVSVSESATDQDGRPQT